MSEARVSGDEARATVFVAVGPDDAFEVFTREIDLWWRTGPQYRIAGKQRGRLFFEPGVGGRLFETFPGKHGERTFQLGSITAWEPGKLLVFVWRGVNFREGESTTVEVTFTPHDDGTMVRVRHYGWAALRDDHPVRHGLVGGEFARKIGMWWGGLMTALREHVAARRDQD